MSWTTPITWVDSSIYAAAQLNQQIRDNLLVLKTSIGNDGRIVALTSTYFASISGLNLTGVGLLASANTWSGQDDFSRGTIVLPVEGAFGGLDNGDMSVVGTALWWRNTSTANKHIIGTLVSTPAGAVTGSLWIDSADSYNLHYIDASGNNRSIPGTTSLVTTSPLPLTGSLWIDDKLYWMGNLSGVSINQHAEPGV